MRCPKIECTKNARIFALIVVAAVIIFVLWPMEIGESRQIYNSNVIKIGQPPLPGSTEYTSIDYIIDYSRCSPLMPLQIFVHEFDHPMAEALQQHPAATEKETEACLFFSFTDDGAQSLPSTWNSSGANHIIVNLNDQTSISPQGKEIIVQPNFSGGRFRSHLDYALFTDVYLFNNTTWQTRPSIMPLHREIDFTLVSDSKQKVPTSVTNIECDGDCSTALATSKFCLLPASPSFQSRLLSSLRAACIPVVLSSNQPLPFEDQLDWSSALLRYPPTLLPMIPQMLEEIEKESVLEMRRQGKVFLSRFDDAEAMAASLVAALSGQIRLGLSLYPEVHANIHTTVAAKKFYKNTSFAFKRLSSNLQTLTGSMLYSRARWNSGRLLTHTPRVIHDVPMMPGDAVIQNGIKENFVSYNGIRRLGQTRDEEQFTVVILTYDRDKTLSRAIEKLRDCPYLNKVIVVWNHQTRRPNGTWPQIHVPVVFVLSERNTLTSRFLPYDIIETEAIFSLDDDCGFTHAELAFGFKIWRENRDSIVGLPERTHSFKNNEYMYGMCEQCEHSLILTGLAFLHKEFLFEFTYNQHPAIIEHIDKQRNCEDIAMNFLVSHLTRKPPVRVAKKSRTTVSDVKTGIHSRKSHISERNKCLQLFTAVYGYNPLQYSQAVIVPHAGCIKGLP